ncbi:MAG: hypothetical protein QM569_14895 [Acidovorax sp.]|uniref:DUF7210 family protein n=1 Tax=Acidovorax sp. TaxID=1872122 RepID=UPI0039E3775A
MTTTTKPPTTTKRKKPAAAAPPAPAPPALERVRLAREHTHLGVSHAPGAEIEVHPDIALWLRAVGAVSPSLSTPTIQP